MATLKNPRNFHFAGNEDDLALPSGAKGRVRANLAAVRLLLHIEGERRMATPREQVVLARWTGWGSVSQVLDTHKADAHRRYVENPPAALTPEAAAARTAETWFKDWGAEHWSIRHLLNEEEFRAGQMMTVDAFYTPSFVVRHAWAAAQRMGFGGGRVVEPGGGIGNFLTYAPPELAAKCHFHAVEMDNISARIFRQIHPNAQLTAADFTKAAMPTQAYDLVIGNVPFGQTPVSDLTMPLQFNTHNYFLAKCSRLLAPGGLCVLLTSRYTLDAYAADNARQRDFLSEQYDLVGAVRFPGGTFSRVAGTDALEDLLFLRRKDPKNPLKESQIAHWSNAVRIDVPDESRAGATKPVQLMVNEYFRDHSEAVLGRQVSGRGQYAEGAYMVKTFEGENVPSVEALLGDRIAKLPENVFIPRVRRGQDGRATPQISAGGEQEAAVLLGLAGEDEFLAPEDRAEPGEYVERKGSIYQVEGSRDLSSPGRRLVVPSWRGRAKVERLASDYVELKSLVRAQIELESRSDYEPDVERSRKVLRDTFQRFAARHGSPRQVNAADPLRFVSDDPCIDLVRELEILEVTTGDDGQKRTVRRQADILSKRVIPVNREPDRAESPDDAASLSMAYRNKIDLDYCAKLLGVDNTNLNAVAAMRDGLRRVDGVFEEPGTGELQTPSEFFSGNLRKKLRACEDAEILAAENGEQGRFARQIAQLQENMPPWEPYEAIDVPFPARWVPEDIHSQFLTELLGGPNERVHVHYNPGDQYVTNSHQDVITGERNQTLFGYAEGGWSALKIAQTMLAMKPLTIMMDVPHPTDPEKTRTVVDPKATEELQVAGRKFLEEWEAFKGRHDEVRVRLETIYNETLNTEMRASHLEGQNMVFPGLNANVVLRPAQRSGAAKSLRKMSGLLDHKTGYGKTFTEIIIGKEAVRLGLSKKVVIGTLNDTHEQYAEAARLLYPGIRILSFNEKSDKGLEGRRRFATRAAMGTWDLILIPHSQLVLIPNHPDTVARHFEKMLAGMDAAIDASKARGEDRTTVKDIVRQRKGLVAMMNGLLDKLQKRQGKEVYWEEIGVDTLIVDEAHIAKRAPFHTSIKAKGLDNSFSMRGLSILMKNTVIQEKRDGKGVIYATATPLSNTLAEFWNMSRQCEPKTMKEMGFEHFDAWAATYCEEKTAPELNEANNKWRVVTRMARYRNVRTLQSLLRKVWDVRMDPKEAGLNLPAYKGGKVQNILVPCTPAVKGQLDKMARVFTAWEKHPERANMPHIPLVLMSYGMSVGIDPRLVDASAPDEPGSVMRRAAREIGRLVRENRDRNGLVLVCVDRLHTMKTVAIDRLDTLAKAYGRDEQEDDVEETSGLSDDTAEGAEVQHASAENETATLFDDEAATAAELAATGQRNDAHQVRGSRASGHGSFNYVHELARMVTEEEGVASRNLGSLIDVRNGRERKSLLDRCKLGGDCNVLFITSSKGGVGINVSARCCGLVEIGPPRDMTPKSAEQVRGRLVRDPNIFVVGGVEHIRIAMEDTPSAGLYHRIQRKVEAFTQIESGADCEQQIADPVSELSLETSEIKALILRDDRILRQTELKDSVRKLEADVRAHSTRRYNLRGALRTREVQQERDEWLLDLMLAAKPRVEAAAAAHRTPDAKKTVPGVCIGRHPGRIREISPEKTEGWFGELMPYMEDRARNNPRGVEDMRMEVGGLPFVLVVRASRFMETQYDFSLLANQDGEDLGSHERALLTGHPSTPKGIIQIWHGTKAALDTQLASQSRTVTSGQEDIKRLKVEVADNRPHPKADELAALRAELESLQIELDREGLLEGAAPITAIPMGVEEDEPEAKAPPEGVDDNEGVTPTGRPYRMSR